jgi:gliding motility-associated-like protein
MKKNILTTLFFCFSFFLAICQPTIQWQKSLGGSDNDYGGPVQQTNDGGFIVTGRSFSNDGDVSGNHGEADLWVVKLNNTGTIEWQKSLGGTDREIAYSIQQTVDGGYIVAGFSRSNDGDVSGNHGNADFWVVKLSSVGTIEWQKSLGGSLDDYAYSILQTNDGGYIVAGFSNSNDGDVSGNHGGNDFWVVKLNDTGTIEWQKSLGGSTEDIGAFMQQTSDGGYILSGTSLSNDGDVSGNHNAQDCWVVKLTSLGTIEWQKSLGGSLADSGGPIQQTNDGGYILSGFSSSNDGDVSGNHGDIDYWIVKLTNMGTIEWQKSLGGAGYDHLISMQETIGGGYILAGYSNSNDGDVSGNHGLTDYWLVKLNNIGTIEWQKSLGGSGVEYAASVLFTDDDGYILTGPTSSNDFDVSDNNGISDYWVVKLTNCELLASPQLVLGDTCITTPLTVQLDETLGLQSVQWNMGDQNGGASNLSTSTSHSHQYSQPGTFTISAIVDYGCGSDTITRVVHTTAVTEPLLSFAYPNDPCRMNNTSPELPTGFASGGIFSVSPALPINSANGTLGLLENIEGDFIVTYSYAGGNCIASGSFSETIAIRSFSESLVALPDSVTLFLGDTVELAASGTVSYNWSPDEGLSCSDCASPLAFPTQPTLYIVTGIDANGCRSVDTVWVVIDFICNEAFIPSIFSPNGKGPQSNEKFCVLSDCVAQFKLVIFNRWGQQVFETEDINQCWDGTFNGADASSGAYAYNVYLKQLDGAVLNKTGTINLVR